MAQDPHRGVRRLCARARPHRRSAIGCVFEGVGRPRWRHNTVDKQSPAEAGPCYQRGVAGGLVVGPAPPAVVGLLWVVVGRFVLAVRLVVGLCAPYQTKPPMMRIASTAS